MIFCLGMLHVDTETVRNRLRASGLHHRRPTSKEVLTARNKADRLAF